jgi:hypothetical protein
MATNTDFIVKNGLVVTDSATFGNTITGTNATFSGTVTATNVLDSAQITSIAIAAGVDSAYVISQINALIDAAPGALNTLNELAAALGDDANFSTTITNLIAALPDSSQVASIVTSYGYSTYDSANTLGLIDSAYIAARTSAGTDSAAIINLIDSSYIQLRQANEVAAPFSLSRYDFTATSGQSSFTGLNIQPNKFEVYLNGLLLSTADYSSTSTQVNLTVAADSGDILNVIKYTGNEVIGGAVTLSQTTYEFIADSSQTVFTGADANALTLGYVSGKIQVYINGILLRGSTDYIATNGTSVTLTLGADSGDVVQIETLTGNNIGLDSTGVGTLIDSAYVQARQTPQNFAFASLTGTPTTIAGYGITDAFDGAYSSLTGTPTFADSAYVTSQINALVDAAPGALDTLNELAAALGDDANFSTTITNLIAALPDSGQVSSIITADVDQAFVEALDVPEATFSIVNNGSSAYTFSGDGFSSSSDNPTLYLTRGHTYKFSVNASGHPFEIRTSNGGSAYSTGVTNNAAQTGDIIFTPDMSAPKNLVYQCQIHSGMVGDIVILDGVIPNGFANVHVSGQNNIVAESSSDVLVFEAGPGISITTDPNTDTVTIINDFNATVAAAIIDSAYVQQRQTHYLDSAAVISIHNSLGGVDSNAIISLIDSAYVAARAPAGGGGGGSGGTDSATVVTLIGSTVDSDYILGKVDFARGGFTLDRWSYTATAAQTVFTGADNNAKILAITDTNLIEVYLNGILLVDSADYSATLSSVTLTTGADAGYNIQIMERRGRVITQRGFVETKYYYTTAVPTTVISGADDNSATLDLSNGYSDVFLNGFLLKDSDDYSTTSTTVTLVSATDSGDLVTVANRRGTVVTPTLKSYNYTADSGQTLITGADDNGSILTYVNGQVQVFLNGILLRSDIDFTAVNGSNITFLNALDSADDVVIATYSAPGTILNQYRYLADSGQTVFNGLDVNSELLSYEPSNTQVFLNGILLTDSDYNATNGISVVLTNAANINDDLVISAYDQGVVQLRRNTWSAPSTTPYTAVAGDKLIIDTSSAKTITLPSIAILGDEIRIIDATGNASANNITVARNGHNILGNASDLTINIDRSGIGLVYYNATQGWILIEN